MRLIDTNPKKGWFAILRLYRPLEPFFAKTWRPSEIAWYDDRNVRYWHLADIRRTPLHVRFRG